VRNFLILLCVMLFFTVAPGNNAFSQASDACYAEELPPSTDCARSPEGCQYSVSYDPHKGNLESVDPENLEFSGAASFTCNCFAPLEYGSIIRLEHTPTGRVVTAVCSWWSPHAPIDASTGNPVNSAVDCRPAVLEALGGFGGESCTPGNQTNAGCSINVREVGRLRGCTSMRQGGSQSECRTNITNAVAASGCIGDFANFLNNAAAGCTGEDCSGQCTFSPEMFEASITEEEFCENISTNLEISLDRYYARALCGLEEAENGAAPATAMSRLGRILLRSAAGYGNMANSNCGGGACEENFLDFWGEQLGIDGNEELQDVFTALDARLNDGYTSQSTLGLGSIQSMVTGLLTEMDPDSEIAGLLRGEGCDEFTRFPTACSNLDDCGSTGGVLSQANLEFAPHSCQMQNNIAEPTDEGRAGFKGPRPLKATHERRKTDVVDVFGKFGEYQYFTSDCYNTYNEIFSAFTGRDEITGERDAAMVDFSARLKQISERYRYCLKSVTFGNATQAGCQQARKGQVDAIMQQFGSVVGVNASGCAQETCGTKTGAAYERCMSQLAGSGTLKFQCIYNRKLRDKKCTSLSDVTSDYIDEQMAMGCPPSLAARPGDTMEQVRTKMSQCVDYHILRDRDKSVIATDYKREDINNNAYELKYCQVMELKDSVRASASERKYQMANVEFTNAPSWITLIERGFGYDIEQRCGETLFSRVNPVGALDWVSQRILNPYPSISTFETSLYGPNNGGEPIPPYPDMDFGDADPGLNHRVGTLCRPRNEIVFHDYPGLAEDDVARYEPTEVGFNPRKESGDPFALIPPNLFRINFGDLYSTDHSDSFSPRHLEHFDREGDFTPRGFLCNWDPERVTTHLGQETPFYKDEKTLLQTMRWNRYAYEQCIQCIKTCHHPYHCIQRDWVISDPTLLPEDAVEGLTYIRTPDGTIEAWDGTCEYEDRVCDPGPTPTPAEPVGTCCTPGHIPNGYCVEDQLSEIDPPSSTLIGYRNSEVRCEWGKGSATPPSSRTCSECQVLSPQECAQRYLTQSIVPDNILKIRSKFQSWGRDSYNNPNGDPSRSRVAYEMSGGSSRPPHGGPVTINIERNTVNNTANPFEPNDDTIHLEQSRIMPNPEGFYFEEEFGYGNLFDRWEGDYGGSEYNHRIRPYMIWWDTGLPSCKGWNDSIVGVGDENRNCGYGGWEELKLYQMRCYRYFGTRCLCNYERTFKTGSSEEYVHIVSGTNITVLQEAKSGEDSTQSLSWQWPLGWRGYVSEPDPAFRFPMLGFLEAYDTFQGADPGALPEKVQPFANQELYGSYTNSNIRGLERMVETGVLEAGLENAKVGDIIIWDRDVLWGSENCQDSTTWEDRLNCESFDYITRDSEGEGEAYNENTHIPKERRRLPHVAVVRSANTPAHALAICEGRKMACQAQIRERLSGQTNQGKYSKGGVDEFGGLSSDPGKILGFDPAQQPACRPIGGMNFVNPGADCTNFAPYRQLLNNPELWRIQVAEMNFGKHPDICGNTDKWGQEALRTIVHPDYSKPIPIPQDLVDREYLPEGDDAATCADPQFKMCKEALWDTVKVYHWEQDWRLPNNVPGAGNPLVCFDALELSPSELRKNPDLVKAAILAGCDPHPLIKKADNSSFYSPMSYETPVSLQPQVDQDEMFTELLEVRIRSEERPNQGVEDVVNTEPEDTTPYQQGPTESADQWRDNDGSDGGGGDGGGDDGGGGGDDGGGDDGGGSEQPTCRAAPPGNAGCESCCWPGVSTTEPITSYSSAACAKSVSGTDQFIGEGEIRFNQQEGCTTGYGSSCLRAADGSEECFDGNINFNPTTRVAELCDGGGNCVECTNSAVTTIAPEAGEGWNSNVEEFMQCLQTCPDTGGPLAGNSIAQNQGEVYNPTDLNPTGGGSGLPNYPEQYSGAPNDFDSVDPEYEIDTGGACSSATGGNYCFDSAACIRGETAGARQCSMSADRGYDTDFVADFLFNFSTFFEGPNDPYFDMFANNPAISWLTDPQMRNLLLTSDMGGTDNGMLIYKMFKQQHAAIEDSWSDNPSDLSSAVVGFRQLIEQMNSGGSIETLPAPTVAVIVNDQYFRGQAAIVYDYDPARNCVDLISSNWLQSPQCNPSGSPYGQQFNPHNCFQSAANFGNGCMARCVPLDSVSFMFNPR
jgi:hypothetical protein